MSFYLWTPQAGMPQIIFEGALELRDTVITAPDQNEWGVDTLERLVRGPAYLHAAYGDLLRKGDPHPTNPNFKLQSWRAFDHYLFPGFNLSYKGFAGGRLPDPLPGANSRGVQVSSLTANDLSVSFGGKTIVSATKEIQYLSPQTTWKYISDGEPSGIRYGQVRGDGEIQDLSSNITVTYDDGTTSLLAGLAPAGVATALFSTPYIFSVGPTFVPIIGTSYFECEETCQLKYVGS